MMPTRTRLRSRRRPGQIRLHISPQRGGALTRWRLTGSLVTAIPYRELRHVIGKLSLWSGSPIELVLPVAEAPDGWRESWRVAIDHVPDHHLEVSFDLSKIVVARGRDT